MSITSELRPFGLLSGILFEPEMAIVIHERTQLRMTDQLGPGRHIFKRQRHTWMIRTSELSRQPVVIPKRLCQTPSDQCKKAGCKIGGLKRPGE